MSHGNKGRRQCKARSKGGWPCWRREGHPGEHTNGGVPFKAVPQPEDEVMNINGKEYIDCDAFDELHRVNMRFVDEADTLKARITLLEAFVEAFDEWLCDGNSLGGLGRKAVALRQARARVGEGKP